ncbi:hypothetical protein BC826DRAFT_976117, partial [Russula brevipes]
MYACRLTRENENGKCKARPKAVKPRQPSRKSLSRAGPGGFAGFGTRLEALRPEPGPKLRLCHPCWVAPPTTFPRRTHHHRSLSPSSFPSLIQIQAIARSSPPPINNVVATSPTRRRRRQDHALRTPRRPMHVFYNGFSLVIAITSARNDAPGPAYQAGDLEPAADAHAGGGARFEHDFTECCLAIGQDYSYRQGPRSKANAIENLVLTVGLEHHRGLEDRVMILEGGALSRTETGEGTGDVGTRRSMGEAGYLKSVAVARLETGAQIYTQFPIGLDGLSDHTQPYGVEYEGCEASE